MSVDENTLHAVVSGRVQGVGFRYYVLGVARPLNLRGTVRNLPDGSVEVLARGSTSDLESLVAGLRLGPRMARVTDVRLGWGVADFPNISAEPGQGFTISH